MDSGGGQEGIPPSLGRIRSSDFLFSSAYTMMIIIMHLQATMVVFSQVHTHTDGGKEEKAHFCGLFFSQFITLSDGIESIQKRWGPGIKVTSRTVSQKIETSTMMRSETYQKCVKKALTPKAIIRNTW